MSASDCDNFRFFAFLNILQCEGYSNRIIGPNVRVNYDFVDLQIFNIIYPVFIAAKLPTINQMKVESCT